MKILNKKILCLVLVNFILLGLNALPFLVFAAETDGYTLLEPSIIIDQDNTQPATGYGLSDYLKTAYMALFFIVIAATIFYLVVGGLEYILSDIPGTKLDGMNKFKKALLGLGIALSSYLILNLINPALLDLNFNL